MSPNNNFWREFTYMNLERLILLIAICEFGFFHGVFSSHWQGWLSRVFAWLNFQISSCCCDFFVFIRVFSDLIQVLVEKVLKIMKFGLFAEIKRKLELVLRWDRVELWWVMILKVIPRFILKKYAHLITGSPRIIFSENLLEVWQCRQKNELFGQKKTILAKNERCWQKIIFKKNHTIKSPHLPQNNLIQSLWSINHFWLILEYSFITINKHSPSKYRKKNFNFITLCLIHFRQARHLHESGAALATRALMYGSLYAFAGIKPLTGIVCITIT